MKLHMMLFGTLFFVAHAFGEPLLVVVLMVKNEAAVLIPTLQPFVDGGVKDFIIFDTGSTDGSQDRARDFFRQHELMNAHIIEEPFVDFSTSRNRALDEFRRIFPLATFMLMPEAECYMHNVEGLLQYCREHRDELHASYFLSIRS